MTYKLDFELIPELEIYRREIEASIKPYLELKLTDNGNPTLWQTKFGGSPYLPKNCDYPKSWKGKYVYLLAQINFAELPYLDDFPEQGILQFYIGDGLRYGKNNKNPTQQNEFRILYFSDVDLQADNLITDFSFLPEADYSPIRGCSALERSNKHYVPMVIADPYNYRPIIDDELVTVEICSVISEGEEYSDMFEDSGHKIGGYPYFLQDDPRPRSYDLLLNEENYNLLFQMDSDENKTISIMWGDVGIGNFFIKRSMLKKLDFSDVIYYWDCA